MSLVRFTPRKSLERGMSTAEYAVGTVAVVGLGILFVKFLSGNFFANIIVKIITEAFKTLL